MRAGLTEDGRIRIDLESPKDREMIGSIVTDARQEDLAEDWDLAEGFTKKMETGLLEDWRNYVTGELREGFQSQLSVVESALKAAGGGDGGSIFINADEGPDWYGALNQARLALEYRYLVAAEESPEGLTPERRMAWLRTHLYQAIQGMVFQEFMEQ